MYKAKNCNFLDFMLINCYLSADATKNRKISFANENMKKQPRLTKFSLLFWLQNWPKP